MSVRESGRRAISHVISALLVVDLLLAVPEHQTVAQEADDIDFKAMQSRFREYSLGQRPS